MLWLVCRLRVEIPSGSVPTCSDGFAIGPSPPSRKEETCIPIPSGAFFSLVKREIRGDNHAVSANYLQGYFNYYAFCWNPRDDDEAMYGSMGHYVNKLRYGTYGARNPMG